MRINKRKKKQLFYSKSLRFIGCAPPTTSSTVSECTLSHSFSKIIYIPLTLFFLSIFFHSLLFFILMQHKIYFVVIAVLAIFLMRLSSSIIACYLRFDERKEREERAKKEQEFVVYAFLRKRHETVERMFGCFLLQYFIYEDKIMIMN